MSTRPRDRKPCRARVSAGPPGGDRRGSACPGGGACRVVGLIEGSRRPDLPAAGRSPRCSATFPTQRPTRSATPLTECGETAAGARPLPARCRGIEVDSQLSEGGASRAGKMAVAVSGRQIDAICPGAA
jgi:hypothetical protein